MSDRDLLTKWIMNVEEPVETMRDVCRAFHADSQGLILLDRYLGTLMCANRFLEHPIFGMQFSHYRAHCQSFAISCRGRVFLAIVACRWRTDRREGRVNTINNLLELELRGHFDKEVMGFLQRFQMGCSTLQPTDFKDPDQLYVWLHEKFKN